MMGAVTFMDTGLPSNRAGFHFVMAMMTGSARNRYVGMKSVVKYERSKPMSAYCTGIAM